MNRIFVDYNILSIFNLLLLIDNESSYSESARVYDEKKVGESEPNQLKCVFRK